MIRKINGRYSAEIKKNLNGIGLVIEGALHKTKINITLKSPRFYLEKAERRSSYRWSKDRTVSKSIVKIDRLNQCVIQRTLEIDLLSSPMWSKKLCDAYLLLNCRLIYCSFCSCKNYTFCNCVDLWPQIELCYLLFLKRLRKLF